MRHLVRAVLALLALPLTALAQLAPDTVAAAPRPQPAVFAYLQYGDTIAMEAVYGDRTIVRGVYVIPKQGRIVWDHALDDSSTPGLLTLSFFPPADQGDIILRQIDFGAQADSMIVTAQDRDGRAMETHASRDRAVAVFGRSLTHIAYLGFHAVQARRPALPFYLTSSGKTVEATVQAFGETLAMSVDGLRIESDWEGGALREVRVPSQGLVVRRLLTP